MDLPQLVGLRCTVCYSIISSIAEGTFCEACGNPVHFECLQKVDQELIKGSCAVCGGNLQNPIAVEVRTLLEEDAKRGPTGLRCPNCDNDSSFRAFAPAEESGGPGGYFAPGGLIVVLMAFAILLGMSDSGKVQCCKCEYVFRPRSRFREIGCLIMLLVLMGGLIGLMIFSIIR